MMDAPNGKDGAETESVKSTARCSRECLNFIRVKQTSNPDRIRLVVIRRR